MTDYDLLISILNCSDRIIIMNTSLDKLIRVECGDLKLDFRFDDRSQRLKEIIQAEE